jgi:isochorismate pyruvate lyase
LLFKPLFAGANAGCCATWLDTGEINRQMARMEKTIIAPEACLTMIEVRAGVDALDRELVALLATRFGYMRAAARVKTSRDAVRDEARKASVIAAAMAEGEALGVPANVIADIWERLVEGSIAYEFSEWDQLRG